MKKFWLPLCCGLVAASVIAGSVRPAVAVKEFETEFRAKYFKPDSKVAGEKTLAKAIEEAKCNVCHTGTSKKMHNPYGLELKKMLSKDTDKADKDKINAAIEKVGAMHSTSDEKSPTWDEMFKKGKLPPAK